MPLSPQERTARLQLIRSETVGAITFYKLLARFGSAIKALDALPLMAQRGGKKHAPRIMTVTEAEEELSKLDTYGAQMIIFGDDDYPEWLSTIEDAPPVLSIMGDSSILSKSCIGIVGARNASANAKRFTHQLAGELGQKGQIIVSGMARGIDTAAHTASLDTGTIAVLAGGIDEIYPTENTSLYHAISEKGCVITEMPIGTKPTAHHFPRRNRIVSGLAKGVVVVEASMRSGSLITARLASEQGREVFAVPGFPGDPRAAGPNSLIQNGAKLVQNADDILVELMAMNAKSIKPQSSLFEGIAEPYHDFDRDIINSESPENAHEIIMQTLSATPLDVDELTRASGLKIAAIQTTLLELELAGIIHRHPGNRVSKAA
jgi:DNA processing protein